MEAKETQTR
jgi:hypothetical protein